MGAFIGFQSSSAFITQCLPVGTLKPATPGRSGFRTARFIAHRPELDTVRTMRRAEGDNGPKAAEICFLEVDFNVEAIETVSRTVGVFRRKTEPQRLTWADATNEDWMEFAEEHKTAGRELLQIVLASNALDRIGVQVMPWKYDWRDEFEEWLNRK